MGFQVIDDPKKADESWEARLLWVNFSDDDDENPKWELDKSPYTARPSKTWLWPYAIQPED